MKAQDRGGIAGMRDINILEWWALCSLQYRPGKDGRRCYHTNRTLQSIMPLSGKRPEDA